MQTEATFCAWCGIQSHDLCEGFCSSLCHAYSKEWADQGRKYRLPDVDYTPSELRTSPMASAGGNGIVQCSKGERIVTDPKTGGQKGVKEERFDLIPFDALAEVARVYGMGAEKYAPDNWLKGYSWRLSLGALLRHVWRFSIGEDRDEQSGLLHLAHAAWHCLTLLTFSMRKLGTDDRSKP